MPEEMRSWPAVGQPAPDCPLPDGSSLLAWRGQPVLLAFAPDEWNPAQAYQSSIFARLTQEFAGEVATAGEAGAWYALDWHGEAATQFGVAGQRALVVLDEQGMVRWRTVMEPDQEIHSGQVLAALESLRPPVVAEERPAGAGGMSRRTFLTVTLAASALLLVAGTGAVAAPRGTTALQRPITPTAPDDTVPVTLTINGRPHRLRVEPRVALLDALRENLRLTGTKKGCDHGQCGACTVHVDGQSTLACLTLAVMNEGRAITTIEGLARGDELHPVQAAFVKHDAFQCGYCTPGQIMAAAALVQGQPALLAVEIREAMSGNLCRCAAYPNIIAAIQEVQRT